MNISEEITKLCARRNHLERLNTHDEAYLASLGLSDYVEVREIRLQKDARSVVIKQIEKEIVRLRVIEDAEQLEEDTRS